MTTIEPKVLDRIRGLLAKAESTEFPAEAEALAAKAAELMARHSVEQAMITDRGSRDETIGFVTIMLPPPYAKAKASLLHTVAVSLNCKSLYLTRTVSRSQVYGHKSDLDMVEFLYTSLVIQATRMATAEEVPTRDRYGLPIHRSAAGTAAYRRSWFLGFTHRIGQRLETAKREATRDAGTGAEIVLAERSKRATAAAYQDFPSRTTRHSTVSRRDGYEAGARAGWNADLGQPRTGSGARRALA